MRRHSSKFRTTAMMMLLLPTSVIIGTTVSNAEGRPRKPAPPTVSERTEMKVSGRDGKPIIGANGKPITVNVGRIPPLPPPPSEVLGDRPPLTPEQVRAASEAPPHMVSIPAETDAEKARRLAPGQAKR